MKKWIIGFAALALISVMSLAQGVPPQAKAPDYGLKFQFTIGPAFTVVNDTGNMNWKDNVGVYGDIQIPISKRFSTRLYMFTNWNTISNYYGADQNLSTSVMDADIRFTFNPASKYQWYALAGLEGYRTAWGNGPAVNKLTYNLGAGMTLNYFNSQFVVNPEIKYSPDLDTFTLRIKGDAYIWKRRVAISPEVKWGNWNADYYTGGLINVKAHTDNWSVGCGLTFRW